MSASSGIEDVSLEAFDKGMRIFYDKWSETHLPWAIMKAGRTRMIELHASAEDEYLVKHEMFVDESLCNPMGNLYGGTLGVIVDDVTSISVEVARKCRGEPRMPHVTVDMHMNFLAAARQDTTIVLESRTKKIGRTLVFTECTVRDKESGKLLYTATHQKFFIRSDAAKAKANAQAATTQRAKL